MFSNYKCESAYISFKSQFRKLAGKLSTEIYFFVIFVTFLNFITVKEPKSDCSHNGWEPLCSDSRSYDGVDGDIVLSTGRHYLLQTQECQS